MINIISISDVHLGRNRIPPETIPNHIRKVLYPHLTRDVDILCIVGDFFDRPLTFGSAVAYEAIQVIHELVEMSERNDFLIRVLRGTVLHDRKQNQYFKVPKSSVNSHGVERVRVVNDIEIELIDGLDISMLYIPDNLIYTDITQAIANKLSVCGLQNVDICMHHGYFNFLLPKNIPHRPHNTLNEDLFLNFVTGVVLNGHVHTADTYDIIINNGSFDRLSHGEEEKKGFFKVTYDKMGDHTSYTFIENTEATIFHTLDVQHDDLEKALKRVRDFIDQYNHHHEKVFLRIIDGSPIKRQAIKKLTARCDMIVVDFGKAKGSLNSDLDYIHEGIDLPMITPSNLPPLIKDHCTKQNVHLSLDYITEKLNE